MTESLHQPSTETLLPTRPLGSTDIQAAITDILTHRYQDSSHPEYKPLLGPEDLNFLAKRVAGKTISNLKKACKPKIHPDWIILPPRPKKGVDLTFTLTEVGVRTLLDSNIDHRLAWLGPEGLGLVREALTALLNSPTP